MPVVEYTLALNVHKSITLSQSYIQHTHTHMHKHWQWHGERFRLNTHLFFHSKVHITQPDHRPCSVCVCVRVCVCVCVCLCQRGSRVFMYMDSSSQAESLVQQPYFFLFVSCCSLFRTSLFRSFFSDGSLPVFHSYILHSLSFSPWGSLSFWPIGGINLHDFP